MQVALDGTEANALAAAAHALAEAGVAHTLLEGRDARRLEPALPEGTAAGLEIPVHGFVDAQALTSALAEAAVARGATLTETQVLGVSGDSSGARVATGDGTVSSDAVIVAAGSWSSALAGRPDQPIVKPIRGQLLRLGMDARPAARVLWGSRCYLVPRNDGTVLVGATVEDVGFDERPTSAGVLGLLDAAFELMPALRDASFADVRTGLRPMAADELPIVGPASTMPHLFLATGHYRNGVLLAPLTASMLADLVLEGQERGELAMMRPSRFGA
jgi:glycine oxidase